MGFGSKCTVSGRGSYPKAPGPEHEDEGPQSSKRDPQSEHLGDNLQSSGKAADAGSQRGCIEKISGCFSRNLVAQIGGCIGPFASSEKTKKKTARHAKPAPEACKGQKSRDVLYRLHILQNNKARIKDTNTQVMCFGVPPKGLKFPTIS